MLIRDSVEEDLPQVLQVHRAAFGGEVEAGLVETIFADPSARPLLSLIALDGERALGHVLFSRAWIAGPEDAIAMAILAPLAVVPEVQGKGVGSRLVERGLDCLAKDATAAVFVLGDPRYYGRFRFSPATPQGLLAPYSLPPAYAEAWMALSLSTGGGDIKGTVTCCKSLMQPGLWTA